MNNGGEAADQMVREALQVTEVAIKQIGRAHV